MMTQTTQTLTTLEVATLSVYSEDAGGRKAEGLHRDAIVWAYKHGLLCGDLNPTFDGQDNLVTVPKDMTLILKYDQRGGFFLYQGTGRNVKIIATGVNATPASNNPQQGGGHTVYATDSKGFSFSFHGHLV